MKEKLENKLFEKYPKLFEQRKLPITATAMCWGIECGDGWFNLIETVCDTLQFHTDSNNYPQIVFTQVKEKFGGLRLYHFVTVENEGENLAAYGEKSAFLNGIISFAERMSLYICEDCGNSGKLSTRHSWLKTLCNKHRESHGFELCRKELE